MQKPTFDPGLTQQVTGNLRRAINEDGSFNVHRRGVSWKNLHPYLFLLNLGWPTFLTITCLAFLTVNLIFAGIYFLLPVGELQGADAATPAGRFLNSFFFSAHTLTTVGYGNIAPVGIAANFLAALEAFVGLMGFAIATGLMFGRFSKPTVKIGFSQRMLVTPYQDRTSLQFRIVNLRPNLLMDIDATLLLMTVEGVPLTRKFTPLALERDKVNFLPITWTVVHPIDETSALFGKTPDELARVQAEILILIRAFDDTFSQMVHTRYSYRYDEFAWNAKFTPAFEIDSQGDMILDVDRVGNYVLLDKPGS